MFPDGSHRQLFTLSPSAPNLSHPISLEVGSLGGRVLKGNGSTPVATAQVHLVLSGHVLLTAPTKEDGSFLFPYVVSGIYDLMVTGEGEYFDLRAGVLVTEGNHTEVSPIIGGSSSLKLALIDRASGLPLGGGKISLALIRPGMEDLY